MSHWRCLAATRLGLFSSLLLPRKPGRLVTMATNGCSGGVSSFEASELWGELSLSDLGFCMKSCEILEAVYWIMICLYTLQTSWNCPVFRNDLEISWIVDVDYHFLILFKFPWRKWLAADYDGLRRKWYREIDPHIYGNVFGIDISCTSF